MKTLAILVILSCLYLVVGCRKSNEESKAQIKDETNSFIGIGIISEEIIVKANVYITYVFPDTPAAKTDLQAGDQILKVNGVDIRSRSDMRYIISSLPPKTVIELVIMRDGKELTIVTYTDIIKR